MPIAFEITPQVKAKIDEFAKAAGIKSEEFCKIVIENWVTGGGLIEVGRKKGDIQRIALDWPMGFMILMKDSKGIKRIDKVKGVYSESAMDAEYVLVK
ncbi:MAG: hypothetical protein WED04_05720 [Promethearchaeati archaeon SRVP18_Atabeyarchaeia-1]